MGETFHREMAKTFSRMVINLVPGTRPREAEQIRRKLFTQWPLPEHEWRANTNGRVRVPKCREDERRLRELHAYCREANHDEMKTIAMHYPYLLSLTDRYGNSALHAAVMSGHPGFVAKLLALYRHPRAHQRRIVRYEDADAFLNDGLSFHEIPGDTEWEPNKVIVSSPPFEQGLADAAEVLPGDLLETVVSDPVVDHLRRKRRIVTTEKVLRALAGTERIVDHNFPIELTFSRPAHAELLAEDAWKFLDVAAGTQERFRKVKGLLQREWADLWKRLEPLPTEQKQNPRPAESNPLRRPVELINLESIDVKDRTLLSLPNAPPKAQASSKYNMPFAPVSRLPQMKGVFMSQAFLPRLAPESSTMSVALKEGVAPRAPRIPRIASLPRLA